MYLYSWPTKKKNLSFLIGPPTAPPKSLNSSLALMALPEASLGEKKLAASRLSWRKNSNTLPEMLFLPLRVTTLIDAPELRPYSAEKFDV